MSVECNVNKTQAEVYRNRTNWTQQTQAKCVTIAKIIKTYQTHGGRSKAMVLEDQITNRCVTNTMKR